MPEQSTREPRITGEDILLEILRNMEEGLFRIRYTTLVPSVFRIYLSDKDYEPLRAAIPFLVEEAKRALNERLSEWSKSGKFDFLRRIGGGPPQTEYKILGQDWTVELYPDMEGKLGRGDIEIYSELGEPPKPEYGAGALTTRISRRDADGRRSTTEVPADATVRGSERAFARLRYTDNDGPHVFAMVKNQLAIGRGGKAYWVDLKLNTLPDVSREHCRIRRDPASGKFLIKDMSEFGTTVNSERIPSSIEKKDGEEKDKNLEVALPLPARIGLADVLFLEFEEAEAR
jgi:hypothetical protein